MKRIALVLAALLFLISGCKTESKYHLMNVSFEVEVADVSKGHIHAYFYPSTLAYYVTGCVPLSDKYDPVNITDHFMTLMVDSLYIDYLDWRHDYLKDKEDYIADFASHSLQYGDSEKYFQNLQPDTDYWLYAFVVDPGTKEPYGDLWVTTVHTDSLETYNIWFDTRVQGSYFYMYPRGSEGGDIVEGIPYTGGIIDALDLVEACPLPLDFEGKMDKYCEQAYDLAVDYGTLANITYSGVKQINYAGRFKTGRTYYVIIGELQGGIVNRAYFRFVYDPSVHTQEVALVKRDPYWTESSD